MPRLLNSASPSETAYTSKDHTLAVEGGEITVRSYVPASATDDTRFPMLFWTHGGGRCRRRVCHLTALRVCVIGWVIGNLEMDDYYLKILSVELQLVIVSPDYRSVRSRAQRGIGHVYSSYRDSPRNTLSPRA